ncbi:MAG: nitrogen fixation protein FixH [Rhodoferax sp.]|nr:nitrogen fixation protein FixH [Rhodoferax sp.]
MAPTASVTVPPWWRFGYVWLVLSGPAVVVVASVVTAYLAYVGMDTVLDQSPHQRGGGVNQAAPQSPTSLAPATQARNHAATGVVVAPKGH